MTEDMGSRPFVYSDAPEESAEVDVFKLDCEGDGGEPLIRAMLTIPVSGRRELCRAENSNAESDSE